MVEGGLFVTNYDKKGKDCTLLIQGNQNPLKFVEKYLPEIFKEVLQNVSLTEQPQKNQPLKRKQDQKPNVNYECNDCEVLSTSKKRLGYTQASIPYQVRPSFKEN